MAVTVGWQHAPVEGAAAPVTKQEVVGKGVAFLRHEVTDFLGREHPGLDIGTSNAGTKAQAGDRIWRITKGYPATVFVQQVGGDILFLVVGFPGEQAEAPAHTIHGKIRIQVGKDRKSVV